MHRILVIAGIVLCLAAIAAYSFWPVEAEYEDVTDPANGQTN